MDFETEPNDRTAWLYAAFALVLLAALVFAPNPVFAVTAVVVLALFYQTNTIPSQAVLEHQPHP